MKNIITLLLALSLLLGACALADDRADMLVAAAVNELGYSATKGGYSKYGEWGGSAYGEWCSEFVSWCVNFADEYYGASMLGNDYPLQTSCEGGAMWYKERGRYVTVNDGLRGAVAVDAQVHLRLAGGYAPGLGGDGRAAGDVHFHQVVFFQLLLAHGRGGDEYGVPQPHGDVALVGVDQEAAVEQFGRFEAVLRLARAFVH